MFVVVFNLGVPGSLTDWGAVGPFETQAAADAVMEDVNTAAAEGFIVLDRVLSIPIEDYSKFITNSFIDRLVQLQRGD